MRRITVKVPDAVRELRTNATFALLLTTAWLLASIGYQQALDRREWTRDLTAFLLLRAAVDGSHDLREEANGVVKCFERDVTVGRGDIVVCSPIRAVAPWDPHLTTIFELHPPSDRSVVDWLLLVRAANTFLPFERYAVGRHDRTLKVLRRQDYRAARQITDAMHLNDPVHLESRSPMHWTQTAILLRSLGHPAERIDSVRLNDAAVTKLIADYLSNQGVKENLAGLAVPIFWVPVGFAVLILLTSLILLGPWIALDAARYSPPTEDSGWILLQVGSGLRGIWSWAVFVLFSATLLVFPIAAVIRTLSLFIQADPWQKVQLTALLVSLAALISVLLANIFAHIRLRGAISRAIG